MADKTLPTSDYYVYAFFRRDNGQPFYIGAGRAGRWAKHESDARAGRGRNHHKLRLIRQIVAIGPLPKIKIAEGLSRNEALRLEKIFIAAIGREPDGPLVNLTAGGDGFHDLSPEAIERRHANQRGVPKSPEVRAKISQALRGRKLGPPSEEARANMRAAQAGHYQRPHTPETRAKMSRTRKGMPHSPEHSAAIARASRGKIISEEAKAKMSAAKKGKQLSEAHKAKIGIALRNRRARDGITGDSCAIPP